MKKIFKNKKGMVSVFLAVGFTVLLGFTALAVDIGQIAVQKSRLQNATDAAALAGAMKLPDNNVESENAARMYISNNDMSWANVAVSFGNQDQKIIVKANLNVPLFFARIFGMTNINVEAQSIAVVGPVNKVYKGLRPFGVVDEIYTLGQQVVLREGAWDSVGGNFGTVNFDGSGANIYRDTITYGSQTGVTAGEYISTEPGGMVGPTVTAIRQLIAQCPHTPVCTPTSYQLDCPRIITVPIIDSLDVNGRTEVMVLGFARFFLEGARNAGGHTEITGTFVEEIDTGGVNVGGQDFGLRSIKLID